MRLTKIIIILICIWIFVSDIYAQRNLKPLEGVEAIVSKQCNSPAEIIRSFSNTKTARIYLFLDEEYFNRKYLIKFFTCISRNYAELNFLDVTLISNRKELDDEINKFLHPAPYIDYLPGTEPPLITEVNPKPPNYYRAHYMRNSVGTKKEYFEYNPDPQKWKMITYKFRKTTVPLLIR